MQSCGINISSCFGVHLAFFYEVCSNFKMAIPTVREIKNRIDTITIHVTHNK